MTLAGITVVDTRLVRDAAQSGAEFRRNRTFSTM